MNRLLQLSLLVIAIALPGCASKSVAELEGSQHHSSYMTTESPAETLSAIAMVAEDVVGPPELVDHAAGRLVISQRQPVYGNRTSLLVVRVFEDDGGAKVVMWSDGMQPAFGRSWADKLWAAYAENAAQRNVTHAKID